MTTDRSVPWRISGSLALREACRRLGPNVSAVVDRAVRALLAAEGRRIPPPLPPKRNGRAPKGTP
jgi:hypothetical protein